MTDKSVYFMRPIGCEGPIKIGCSKLAEKRLRSLEIWSPAKLELICAVPGCHNDENILHQMFGVDRLHGEWFRASPALLDLIEYVQASGKLPPLDKNLSPYRTGVSSMTPRTSPALRRDKHALTKSIMKAERRVYGYAGHEYLRPDDINDIVQSYQGFNTVMPTDGQIATIREYITALNQMPARKMDLSAWYQWRELVCGDHLKASAA